MVLLRCCWETCSTTFPTFVFRPRRPCDRPRLAKSCLGVAHERAPGLATLDLEAPQGIPASLLGHQELPAKPPDVGVKLVTSGDPSHKDTKQDEAGTTRGGWLLRPWQVGETSVTMHTLLAQYCAGRRVGLKGPQSTCECLLEFCPVAPVAWPSAVQSVAGAGTHTQQQTNFIAHALFIIRPYHPGSRSAGLMPPSRSIGRRGPIAVMPTGMRAVVGAVPACSRPKAQGGALETCFMLTPAPLAEQTEGVPTIQKWQTKSHAIMVALLP